MTFCIDRAGIVGEDGVTHHGLLDIAYLRCIPNMRVASPADEETLRNLMFTSLKTDGPLAIRYPRGKATTCDWQTPFRQISVGKARVDSEEQDSKVAVLTIGPALSDARKAKEILKLQGIPVDVYDMIWVKPLDEELLARIASSHEHIVTVEDGVANGGFGSAVTEWCRDNNCDVSIHCLGVDDRWVTHGTVAELKKECGYDAEGIASAVIKLLS